MPSLRLFLKEVFPVVLVWIMFFGYYGIKTIYEDHMNLVTGIQALKRDIKNKDQKIGELEAELKLNISRRVRLPAVKDENAVKLKGEIHSVVDLPKKAVLFVVTISNTGADSIATNYQAKAYFGNQEVVLQPSVILPPGISLNTGNGIRIFHESDQLWEKSSAIKKGEPITGILAFKVISGNRYDISNADVDLFFDDYLGKTYKARFNSKEAQPRTSFYIPGMGGEELK